VSKPPKPPPPELVRGLGAGDAALVTVGSVLGTGIFLTTADVARAVPHAGLVLLLWVAGGLLTLAGALTYAELGTLYPRAGGPYHFLKAAYGRFAAFLFGWAAFLVIMSGGIATLAVGFGEYLGSFIPFFSTDHRLWSLEVAGRTWSVSGGQLAGALVVVLLTGVNCAGLRQGAATQNVVTGLKIASLAGLAVVSLAVDGRVAPDLAAAPPGPGLAAALGVGLIGVFWSYDGWYGVTYLGGEIKRPDRDLPLGLITGTLVVTVLYAVMNLVYLRAIPVEEMGATPRIAEASAAALLGPAAGRLVSLAVLVSIFGCISSTILYSTRTYLPMAQDGVFFRSLAEVHPVYRTPVASILAQGAWTVVLTLSGTFEQLYTYVVFAVFLFHAATAAAVFVLRRTRADAPRPYRVWGYPVVPAAFILVCLAFVLNTLREKPEESAWGLGLIALGIPAYGWWRRRSWVS
jgi:APA family basic amino acid/polyamine antiporter